MFYYRYQCLFTTCPIFGMVGVYDLFTTCPKIEHLNFAALPRIMGRHINQIAPMAQFSDASMVSGFRTNFSQVHHFLAINKKFTAIVIDIPKLKEGKVQTDVRRI